MVALSLIAALISPAFSAAGPEAARVAIIKYDDKTGTKNFEYMPGSLQDAITKSMHKKFEFIEVDASKVEPIAAEIRAKNKGKIGPKEAAEICRRADIDILIYGNFTFDQTKNAIEINTDISLGSTDKFRTVTPVQNRVDATIFGAADKVAGDITVEITKVAQEQQQARGKLAEEKGKKGKTQLAKTEKEKTWADTNWMITLAGGPTLPLISRSNADPKVDGALDAIGVRRLKGGWHIGLLGSLGGIKSQSNSSGAKSELRFYAGAATGGYFFDLSPRWRATSALGLGYYFADFSRYQDCGSNCANSGFTGENFKVKNPFAVARLGIHFLLFSFLSLGLEADYRMFFDSAGPVQAAHATLSIAAVF